MKRLGLLVITGVFFALTGVRAQEIPVLLKQADNLEKQLKETDALALYQQVLLQDPKNGKALVRSAELNAIIGGSQKDPKSQRLYYASSLAFAQRAYLADSNQADAAYVMAMALGKMTDIETDKRQLVDDVRQIRVYAEKALSLNPDHGRANYAMGKWEYQVATLAGWKKAAVKLFYGGLPDASLDKAISYMEKCRHLEPYFVQNYLDLAKAYQENHQPAQAIEVLTQLVKLPTRSSLDPSLKAAGAAMLQEIQ